MDTLFDSAEPEELTQRFAAKPANALQERMGALDNKPTVATPSSDQGFAQRASRPSYEQNYQPFSFTSLPAFQEASPQANRSPKVAAQPHIDDVYARLTKLIGAPSSPNNRSPLTQTVTFKKYDTSQYGQ